MDKKLHIISFSIPFPANYGGVIDVFYKVKALYEAGVKITLHCFQYDREPAGKLEQYCEKVYYYPRKMVGAHLLGFHPFIVSSRKNETLLENLLKDDSTILFEGLHTCYWITDDRLRDRKKIVRSHNIEHDYYASLAEIERKPMKRLYFKSEAKKLKRFEEIAFKNAQSVLGISEKDTNYLNSKYGNAVLVSAFHQFDVVKVNPKPDQFAFYHGNLSVGENNEAAVFLVDKVFRGLDYKLVIAGNQPSLQLKKIVEELPNVELKDDLSSEQINHLIYSAKINILPTFQSTGIKLKLLAALYNGGHCLVNTPMVVGTGLEEVVQLADSPEEFKEKVIKLSNETFSEEANLKRSASLQKYSNDFNLQLLLKQF